MTTLTRSDEQIYDFLLQQADPPGNIEMTQAEIARQTAKSPKTVWTALEHLVEDGRIVERRSKRLRIRLPGNLCGHDLSGQDLRGMDLSGSLLVGANLAGANLEGAVLHQANLMDATLDDANLQGAQLQRASLINTSMRGANITNANLRKIDSLRVDFTGAVMVDVDACGGKFLYADFTDAEVSNFRAGTPLNYTSCWDFPTLGPAQLSGVVGATHATHLIERFMYRSLSSQPMGPFIAGMVGSRNYGCWPHALCRIALYFQDCLATFVADWRTSSIDPEIRLFLELELTRLSERFGGMPEPEFWNKLLAYELPKMWQAYSKANESHGAGSAFDIRNVATDEELDEMGGVVDSNFQTAGGRPAPSIPSFLTEQDQIRLESTFQKVGRLSIAELAALIDELEIPVHKEVFESEDESEAVAAG